MPKLKRWAAIHPARLHCVVVERGTPCTSILLVVGRNTPCTSLGLVVEGIHPARLSSVGGNVNTLHICTSSGRKGYMLLVVEMVTPCLAMLLAVKRGTPCLNNTKSLLLVMVVKNHENAGMPEKS
jgi:hypothetical protein